MSYNIRTTTFSHGRMRVCGHIPRDRRIQFVIVCQSRTAAPGRGAIIPPRVVWCAAGSLHSVSMTHPRPRRKKRGISLYSIYIYYPHPLEYPMNCIHCPRYIEVLCLHRIVPTLTPRARCNQGNYIGGSRKMPGVVFENGF